MKTNILKRIFAAALAMSVISIPSLSLAAYGAEETLVNINFQQHFGEGEDDGKYTLDEIPTGGTATGVQSLTEGDAIVVEQAESGSWTQPKIQLAEAMTEADEQHMVGFDIPLGKTITTGRLTIKYSMSGMSGLLYRRYPVIMNGNVPIFSDKATGWAFHTSATTNEMAQDSHFYNKEFVFERESEDEDWTVNVQFQGWNNWQTFTISKEYLPEITSIGSGSDLIPSNLEQSICMRYEALSIKYAPLDIATASVAASTVRTVAPTIDVTFDKAVTQTVADSITFAASGVDMVNSAALSADGLTVTLSLADLTDGTAYTLTVPEGTSVAALTKEVTADADLNKIYSLNFAGLNPGAYTAADLQAIEPQFVDVNANSTYIVDEDGYALIKWDGASSEKNINFKMNLAEPLKTGNIAFDIKFNNLKSANNTYSNSPGSIDRRMLGFVTDSATSDWSPALICMGATVGGGISTNYTVNGSYPTFVSGATNYDHNTISDATVARETFDIRVVAMRDTTSEPWQIRVYDRTEGFATNQAIMITTLSCNEIRGITGWYTAQATADTRYVAVQNMSAEYISESSISALAAATVKNSAGAVITTLTDETVAADGIVNVSVDVNKLGGRLYAAIYNNGWKLLTVQSAPVTQTGTVTFPFTNVDPSITSHIKVFYWDNGFKPLSTTIDPLVRS